MFKKGHAEVVITSKGCSNKIHPPYVPACTLKKACEEVEKRKGYDLCKIRFCRKGIERLFYNQGGKDVYYIHRNKRESADNKISSILLDKNSISKALLPEFF